MQTSYRSLRKELPKDIFKPYNMRLLSLIMVQLAGATSIASILYFSLPWYLNLSLGLFAGYCWGVNGLMGHELMHGNIVRNKTVQNFFGFFCFLPFMISSTFWKYWHNYLHHSHTQKNILDPDAYPTKRIYTHSKFMQRMYPFTPGSGKKRSYLYFFFFFSVNVAASQFYFRFRNKIFDKLDHKRVNIELAALVICHAGFLYIAGPSNWLWVYIIPFAIQNYLPFSYISTNHNLSPLTKENDPLINSLTVTNHPILEFFHINFGYHVEHHLFPTVSSKHLKLVHEALKTNYPDKYQYMPKWTAIKKLYSTARIYKNSTTLINPLTGNTYDTINPKEAKVVPNQGEPQTPPPSKQASTSFEAQI